MHRPGRIEVVCGSMFSGKTEELIRRMKRAKFAKQRVEIFKPSLDTRYSEVDVVSHDRTTIPSTPVDSSSSILLLASDIDVVGIDEAQFLDEGLVDVCNQLANREFNHQSKKKSDFYDFYKVSSRVYTCNVDTHTHTHTHTHTQII